MRWWKILSLGATTDCSAVSCWIPTALGWFNSRLCSLRPGGFPNLREVSEHSVSFFPLMSLKTAPKMKPVNIWLDLCCSLRFEGIALKIQALRRLAPGLVCSLRCPQRYRPHLARCHCSGKQNQNWNKTMTWMNTWVSVIRHASSLNCYWYVHIIL